jgi:hypothetical protein
MRRKIKLAHLLKKTSPDLLLSCVLHLEGLTRSITGDHSAPWESARATSLQKNKNTTLFVEVPCSILLFYHNSHRKTKKKNEQRTRPIHI